MAGGNITFAINKIILPYFEYSYFPGIPRDGGGNFPNSGIPYTYHTNIPLSDIHGGVHIRFPIFHEGRVVPYGVFGVGGLRHSARTVTATFSPFPGQTATQSVQVDAGTDKAINYGGGIRYYMSQRFGVRVEAKAYKPYGDSNSGFTQTFGKVEGGFFFQLR
jgi:hypothetical protein